MTLNCVPAAAAAILLAACFASAQDPSEEGIRQLWNTQFLKKRPPAKTAAPARPAKAPVYKPVSSVVAPIQAAVANAAETVLGVTLWRLRRPQPNDDPNSRLLVLEADSSASDWVPERLNADTPVREGDRVRLTVEVPRNGYLYVIDREQYADGTTSAPYLIYPNYLTRAGDNVVSAGRVIEIPDQRDKPNHFRIRRSRPDQVAEVLTLLVTPELLPGLEIGRQPLRLPEEKFKEWNSLYGVQAERFELQGGAGASLTKAEKDAGAGSTLTQDDPMPQTLFRIPSKGDSPILVQVPVRIAR